MWRRIELIAVGDEVLRGEFLENNTSFLSRELTMLGHSPWRITMLGDDRKILSREISEAVKRSDTVIVTGGLGPTVDDVTKDAVIDALGCGTEWRDEIAAKIERRFRLLGKKVPESYKDQARVPAGARILENRIGMAVGLEIEGEDFRIILLPGVPAEMKQIFYESILPAVPVEDSGMRVRIRTFGLTETQLEEKIKDILSELEVVSIISSPRGIDIYIPRPEYEGGLKGRINEVLGSYVFTVGDKTLQEVVVEKLIYSGITISTAESLTGGLLTSLIVDVPGASGTLLEGVIAYSNEAKTVTLGVREASLREFGAVSEEVCREMAIGAKKRAGSALAVSTTGIAGPSGGTDEKPVGLCFVGLAVDSGTYCRRFIFPGDREMVRELAAHYALDLARLYVGGFKERIERYYRKFQQ